MKLNAKAFGLVCGIIWAGAIFVMTIHFSLDSIGNYMITPPHKMP